MMRTSQRLLAGKGSAKRRGFVLIALALAIVVLIGLLGLTLDLARMYIAKNELQTYTDAAAAAANLELDGTNDGVARARQVATTYPNRWNLATEAVTSVTTAFSIEKDGPYVAEPPSPPTNYKYVRVEAEGGLPLYFMSVFFGANENQFGPAAFLLTFQLRTAQIGADSKAGQLRANRFSENLLPYAPDAHLDPGRPPVTNPGFTEPDPFNFVIGKQYTLRWPPPGLRDNPAMWCEGDRQANFVTPDGFSERGFIDIGELPGSGGSSYIRQAIISNVQSHPLEIGQPVVNVMGNRGTESAALEERVSQDTDTSSTNWTDYKSNRVNGRRVGNGRRVAFVPVDNPFDGDRIIDFAAFLLPASGVCGNSAVAPCCAEYIGPGLMFGRPAAAKQIGVFYTRLLR